MWQCLRINRHDSWDALRVWSAHSDRETRASVLNTHSNGTLRYGAAAWKVYTASETIPRIHTAHWQSETLSAPVWHSLASLCVCITRWWSLCRFPAKRRRLSVCVCGFSTDSSDCQDRRSNYIRREYLTRSLHSLEALGQSEYTLREFYL